MKKRLHRLLSVLVVLAMVVTMVSVKPAQAAGKPKLNTTKKTLLVGRTTTLKVKNAAKGSTFTWSSSDEEVAAVNKKGVVTAKEAGKAVVACKVKTADKTYNLKADITVKDSVTVATRKGLKNALANEGLTKVKVNTDKVKKFIIGEGDYSNKLLIVEAPNADVSNNGGVFERVALRGIAPDTWIERAVGNKFTVSSPESRIVIGQNASVKKISYTEKDGEAKLDVRGNVDKVAVKSNTELNIVGKAKLVNIDVTSAGTDAKITASIPVAVKTEANIVLDLQAGAEDSKVTVTNTTATVVVKNNTTAEIVVTTPEGEVIVAVGTDEVINPADDTNNGGGSGSSGSGGSGGGPSTPSTPGTETEEVKITGVLEGTNTVYTLTGADSFEALKSVQVTVQAKDGSTTIGKTLSIAIGEQLLTWKHKAESYLANDTAEANGIANWNNITEKTYTYDSYTMTITGTAGEAAKVVTVNEAGKEYKANVTVSRVGNNIVAEIIAVEPDSVAGEAVTVTFVSANEVTVSRNGGAAHTIKMTDTTITVVGYDTISTDSNYNMSFGTVTK